MINRARHGAGDTDEAVKYVTLMENYYAHGKTQKDQEELTKAQNITINKDTVTIAGLKIERKKSGKAKGKRALEEKEFLPTLDEWQMIIDALPGGREWHTSLQKILGIDIYEKSYWGWDSAKSTVIITRMSGLAESRKLNPKTSIDPDEEAHLRFVVRGDSLAQ